MKTTLICVVSLLMLLLAAPAPCMVLTTDTTWSGDVALDQDILVPEGVTLTIQPGSRIRVSASESTKTDPEYLSSLTEIIVRGKLLANGNESAPILFEPAGDKKWSWAGIIIDGGSADIRFSDIRNAETGVYVLAGSLSLTKSLLSGNRYGITVQGPEAKARLRNTRIRENEYGIFLLNNAKMDSADVVVQNNRKKDRYEAAVKDYAFPAKEYVHKAATAEKNRVYGDEALLGTTIWQGRVAVNGIIRVPENSRLIILPGTLVEFSRKDTNNDTIGENGILIQGGIVAKGTRENPIIFRSAEKQRRMGDWDSINIMNSDKAQNLIEYCQIEDAYRGLHFHFAQVAVSDAVIRNNYRGVQFQESSVAISRSFFYGNKSAFQSRDSEITFMNNAIYRNYTGMNIFRNSITMKDSVVRNNYQEGVRVREGLPVLEGNLMDGNRHGLMVSDAVYGTYSRNIITHNMESGISLRNTDALEISGNVVQANGMNGINIQDSAAAIQGNLISDNGERGIGVQSFQGAITGNILLKNKLYNLGIDGAADVAARLNWWGEEDLEKTIYDQKDDPSKGRAEVLPVLDTSPRFNWPLNVVPVDSVWHGDVAIMGRVVVEPGAELAVRPNARVLFAEGAGLTVRGKMLARGEQNAPVTFASSQAKGAAAWDEILIDHAAGSMFSHCVFEDATWALHSHFTDLRVDHCFFANNQGGIRFTSGPIEVRRSFFSENEVGIRAFRGAARIADNVITKNRIGIFVREKGGGLTIRHNDLYANSDYNVRMGDFNDEDADARENWWGKGDPSAGIYDARTEPGIGFVRYVPYAKKPFSPDAPVDVRRKH